MEEVANTASEEAAVVDTTAEDAAIELVESDSGAPPKLDDYDQRIESLLEAHTSKNAKLETEVKPEPLREGESWQQVLEAAPDDVQRAMHSLRSDYTKKTQEISKMRKELERQQNAFASSDAYQALQKIAEEETGELDPFNPDSFNGYINKIVAQKLQEVLEPMRQEQLNTQAQHNLESFMEKHSELKTDQVFRKEVHETLLSNESLDLEAAYWIVQGRRAKASSDRDIKRTKRTKKAARAAGLTVGSGRKAGATIPKDERLNAWDIYDHLLQQK